MAVHIATASRNGTQNAVALQVLIGASHGIRIDAQLGRELAYRGQGIIAFERSGGNGMLELGFDLKVDRCARPGLHSDNHLY